ncbi:MAG: DUF4168 domain-containing protein [Bacteroidales bacterium]
MKLVRKSLCRLLLVFTLIFFGGSLIAQGFEQQPAQQKEYSDEEIDLFASTVVKVIPIQQKAQQDMVNKIQENDMTVEAFNQISNQVQTTGNTEGITEAEMKKFQKISGEIDAIQQGIQAEVNETITGEGMDPQVYQEMVSAYNTDPRIQKKVDEKLAEQE